VVIGNVATDLFLTGTKEEIEQAVKECIDIGAKGGAYILAPGCGIPPDTPAEKIHAFMEARKKYGSYETVSAL
jgi:uroporphyrinogen decarboxylase